MARAVLALLAPCGAFASPLAPQHAGVQQNVVFKDYSPLFSNAEIARRLLSPLAAAQLRESWVRAGQAPGSYPIDLENERFVVYVPRGAPPPAGFALLVFVPPWDETSIPSGWSFVLDRDGIVFVSAGRSGNTANVLDRRVPLALAAAENVLHRYPVDPQRIYLAGFSGGSRVALRIALGYPDVFRGALLNAGSDPLGGNTNPLPPRDLFLRFQSSTHLLYVTGDRDTLRLDTDAGSLASMRKWCVFGADAQDTFGVGHELMSSAVLERALERLTSPVHPDPARLTACRAAREHELQGELGQAAWLISSAQRSKAHRLLLQIDAQFGGLAAPRSVELARESAGR